MTYSERLAKATSDFIFLRDHFIGNYKTNLVQIAKQYNVSQDDLIDSISK